MYCFFVKTIDILYIFVIINRTRKDVGYMQELLNILTDTKSTLDNYYEIHKNEDFSNRRNTPKDYLE